MMHIVASSFEAVSFSIRTAEGQQLGQTNHPLTPPWLACSSGTHLCFPFGYSWRMSPTSYYYSKCIPCACFIISMYIYSCEKKINMSAEDRPLPPNIICIICVVYWRSVMQIHGIHTAFNLEKRCNTQGKKTHSYIQVTLVVF